jgi:TRAP-type C4-dicarboxylate transport system substrate-binding protein
MTHARKNGRTPISRRLVLAGAATASLGATLGISGAVRAQQRRKMLKPLVAGLNSKPGDPTYESIAKIAQILRDKHNVDVEIQVHPSSVLGSDTQQLEAVQTGFIDITSNVTAQFSSFSDAFSFVDLPYAITSWDMYKRLLGSDLWKQQTAKFEAKVPLKVLPPVGAGGFRILWNNKRETPTPQAVNGLKYRTTNSQLEIALVRGWGGNPTPMAWTETYNALSNGVVDGIHVQPIWTYGFNMHEVLKYGTEVNAIFAVQFQVMNMNTWKSMPPDIQQAFWAAATEAADAANEADRNAEGEFKKKLIGAGMKIHTPSAEKAKSWQKAGEETWDSVGKNIDRDVMNSMMALR